MEIFGLFEQLREFRLLKTRTGRAEGVTSTVVNPRVVEG